MDLFKQIPLNQLPGTPLAECMRPRSLDEVIGQQKNLGPNSVVLKLIRMGQVPSLIIWGPPGSGKTTFALALAGEIQAEFLSRNAVDTGAKELKQLGEEASLRRRQMNTRTLLFIDEIHRLNKAQQDVLLSYVERGDLILVGATTENPGYEINRALLSRCRVLVFEKHQPQHLHSMIIKALAHFNLNIEEVLDLSAIEHIISYSDGDARALYNLLEQIVSLYRFDETSGHNVNPLDSNQPSRRSFPLSAVSLLEYLGERTIHHDKKSDNHYDCISAFIKSIRGSDPDASVYYLARMLKGGEDPVFIARRLVISASEDVGNADPRALTIAISGLQAVELIGLPEAAINLAQVTTYLATAPKSNRSYLALKRAQDTVETSGNIPVPPALRSGSSDFLRSQGYGIGYHYSHDGPKGWIKQNFLPEELGVTSFYEPVDRGYEKHINEFLKWLKS